MQSRYIFDKVNQDIVAAIAKQIERDEPRSLAHTTDDLICSVIFIATVTLLIFL